MVILIPGPVWFLFAGVVASVIWVRLRQARVQAVVRVLAVVFGRNLPLVRGLRAAARAESGAVRRILTMLSDRLSFGDPLSVALRQAWWAFPGHILGTIQGAERGGTLPSVLRALAHDLSRRDADRSSSAPALGYFLLLAVITASVVLYIAINCIPSLKAVFQDFGVAELPSSTRLVLSGAQVLYDHPYLSVLILVALVMLVLQIAVGRHFFVRVPDRFQLLPATLDLIAWHVPLLHRVAETRALARQLPVLEASIRSGQDISAAARQAACVDANYFARRRLTRLAQTIESGEHPAAAARRLRFPRPVVARLESAGDRDALSTALGFLTCYYRGLLVHWEYVLVSISVPLVVLLWGVVIGFIVFALYRPLALLMETTIDGIY